MGTFVTDTDKLNCINLSLICIINKNLTRWLPYNYGKLYNNLLIFTQMRYIHAHKLVWQVFRPQEANIDPSKNFCKWPKTSLHHSTMVQTYNVHKLSRVRN